MAPETVLDQPLISNIKPFDVLYVIRGSGAGRDKKINAKDAMESVVINDQDTFEAVIDRVSANVYKFKDGFRSIYFKFLGGGYDMSSASGVLSGGDTWGKIQTNQCRNLEFEGGAYIDFDDTIGYPEINTESALINGLYVRSDLSNDSAALYGIKIDAAATNAKLLNCRVESRRTNVTYAAFHGANDDAVDRSIQYNNCKVEDLLITTANTLSGFKYCHNLVNCIVEDIAGTATNAALIKAYDTCKRIINCQALDIGDSGNAEFVYGIIDSENISNCYLNNLQSDKTLECVKNCTNVSNVVVEDIQTPIGTTVARGFVNCSVLTGCTIKNSTFPAGPATGFISCENLSNCTVDTCTTTFDTMTGFDSCNDLSACKATNLSANDSTCTGYVNCTTISGSRAITINAPRTLGAVAHGFNACTAMSACKAITVDAHAATGTAYGMLACNYMSACWVTDIDANASHGFNGCNYGASLWTDETSNPNNDFIDTNDAQITNQFSSVTGPWT